MNKNTILKGFLPLAVLPLLFWGCSDDKFGSDSSSGKQISFRLQGNIPVSRTTGTTVDNINAFVVNAQTDWSEDPVLFSSQTVARLEGEANAFDYSPKRYYPDVAAFAYYSAYSPVTKNVLFGFNTDLDHYPDNKNTITYFVPAPAKNGDTTQEDLLVAYTPVEGVALTSGAAPSSRGGFDTPVSLNFKHALSRVFVKASNNNKEPVVIKELSLHNLYSEGKLKIDGDINKGYSADYKVLWEPVDTQDKFYDYVLLPTGVSVPAKTEKEKSIYVVGKDQGMLVLPQTTVNSNNDAEIKEPTEAATDFYVEVTYSISNVKKKTVRAAFTDINKLAQGLTFEMGRQYALTLEFSDTAVEFDISVEGWEDDTPAYAATTVVFDENKPEEASDSDDVEHIHDPNSGFIYGQDLLALSDVPVLDGWIFQGYYDSPELGAKQYYDSSLVPQKVFDTNGDKVPDATNWDKAGPSCTLYAHWVEATNVWGASNIYFRPDGDDGFVGSLTFAKSDQTKSGYQGLYFKWGSLIGVAAGDNGDYDSTESTGTYLYIPSINTGKYYKVRAGAVSATYSGGTDDMNVAVQDYAKAVTGQGKSWDDIPYVENGSEEYQIAYSGNDRADDQLTEKSTATVLYKYYMGDICKFLSDKKGTNGSGLTKKWVMPTSDKWKGSGGGFTNNIYDAGNGYTYEKNSIWSGTDSFLPTDVNGRGSAADARLAYALNTDEKVTFPAAGGRDDGTLNDIGIFGNYWSSSVYNPLGAYYLFFRPNYVYPVNLYPRSSGFPVRCVQKL
jgi:hypothetical protein